METYRCINYTIQWVAGLAHYTIYFPRHLKIQGTGNHGEVKNLIDRWLINHGYTNQ